MPSGTVKGCWSNRGLQLGNHYLPTTVRWIWLYLYLVSDVWSREVVAWDVAEREDPGIAGRSGGQGMPEKTDQQETPPNSDPPRGERQCHASSEVGIQAGRAGRAQIHFQATGIQRQPLLRIVVPHSEVPAVVRT